MDDELRVTPPNELTVRRILLDPTEPLEAVHHFFLAQSGQEVTLELGFIDFFDLSEQVRRSAETKQEPQVNVFVRRRFVMSTAHFKKLADGVSRLLTNIDESEVKS
jgi:hypothetical protein